jgi:hypothetical protein
MAREFINAVFVTVAGRVEWSAAAAKQGVLVYDPISLISEV